MPGASVASSAWGGRFEKETAPLAQRFGASVPFDWRLYRYDIAGSIAHSRMLAKQGIIDTLVQEEIERGLKDVLAQIDAGAFEWSIEREDVHLNVEAALGEAGRSLHTARSRNDQVALDVRLYTREAAAQLCEAAANLQGALIDQAERHVNDLLPGYTHLQRAQPISLGHHLLAYVEMLQRDFERFAVCFDAANVSPLGSGALAGVPYAIDRDFVANLLGMVGVSANSLDAVSDRDFLVQALAAAALCGVHLSRLGEELVLWSSAEFRFVDMDDAWATGSSIMPQKKNPDFAELVRGKSGRLIGDLVTALTILKGLPLTYDKDLQEDKEPLFDAVETVRDCLDVAAGMLSTLRFNTDRMAAAAAQDYTTATDLADYLVRKGLPFRDAHHIIGQLVGECVRQEKQLPGLSLADLARYSNLFEPDVLHVLDANASAAARDVPGGTAPNRVRAAVAEAQARLSNHRERIANLRAMCAKVDALLT
ncbi:MAG: argininosuccinate lyase [Chloroflexi bacterium]|nr:argininosuccinate lyase [Chloroflexota bacterium]